MRKHDVRKWLHAILDLLPVILIPVFMIYSHRHTIDSGSIDVPQNQVVDFNQLINLSNTSEIVEGIEYNVYQNNIVLSNGTSTGRSSYLAYIITNFKPYDKYLVRGFKNTTSSQSMALVSYTSDSQFLTYGLSSEDFIYSCNDFDVSYSWLEIIGADVGGLEIDNVVFQPLVFNLTQMFGSGNEPTIQQFNQWYSDDYYDYTLSHKELLKGTSTITYADTDIMSQVVYQLYNSVDKYFNMGNVFNLTGVYDWFNLNIFNGNASISIYIVWNIVLYEFVMDLLFLLYGLFMWFIDMVEKIMDKPFKSIK